MESTLGLDPKALSLCPAPRCKLSCVIPRSSICWSRWA